MPTVATTTYDEIVESFLASAERLEALVKALPDALLDCAEAPGEWTIRQIVHHVADDGDVWCMVLKKAIATPGARVRFEGFPGNEPWANALAFHQRPIAPALELLHAHRQVMAELSRSFSSAWDTSYIVIVDENGNAVQDVHMGQILPMLTGHLLEHIQTIQSICQQNGIAN